MPRFGLLPGSLAAPSPRCLRAYILGSAEFVSAASLLWLNPTAPQPTAQQGRNVTDVSCRTVLLLRLLFGAFRPNHMHAALQGRLFVINARGLACDQ